jgi:hypothetical protein
LAGGRYRSSPEQALWEATRAARDKGRTGPGGAGGALRSGEAKDPPAALELGRVEFEETVGSDGRSSLLGSASRPDGSVQFDVAIGGDPGQRRWFRQET